MQKKTLMITLASITISTAALYGAWYVGYSSGVKQAIQAEFQTSILHTERELAALEYLQANKTGDARSNLETILNTGILLLTDPSRAALMTDNTSATAHATLVKIKKYRNENPWERGDEKVLSNVQTALDKLPKDEKPL